MDSGWQQVPLITAEQRDRGERGGEGGQWPRNVAVSSDASLLLFVVDVGGLYRSLDEGATWEPANVGFSPRGGSAAIIDPHNADRVLVVAANSARGAHHGIYLSTDGAASWRHTFAADYSGSHDRRDQIVFDPTSYDAGIDGSAVAYWSRVGDDDPIFGEVDSNPGLYRTEDGGESWARIPGSDAMGDAVLRHHPSEPILYLAGPSGLWRTDDRGESFELLREGDHTGVTTSAERPDWVWAATANEILVSEDRGQSWAELTGPEGAPGSELRSLEVSPADADRLFVFRQPESGHDFPWFVSHDGGMSWREPVNDPKESFLPRNGRQLMGTWHPSDPDVAWAVGGDWPTKTTDGGLNWRRSSDGYACLLVGGRWNFSAQDPDTLFFGSQDYNGAITTDGGHTWRYVDAAGLEWGGFTYGGHTYDGQTLWVANSSGWGGERILRVSYDAGITWIDQELKYEGMDASFGTDQALFASDMRSTDGGRTWTRMADVRGVLGQAPDGSFLYGVGQNLSVVTSDDHGATWQEAGRIDPDVLAAMPDSGAGIMDVAYDHESDVFYLAAGLEVWRLENGVAEIVETPRDQFGNARIRTVAVDPVEPSVVYVGSAGNLYASDRGVQRSVDGGRTWENLTLNEPLSDGKLDGGREAICIRVHPQTRELWVATSCYGMWKIAAP